MVPWAPPPHSLLGDRTQLPHNLYLGHPGPVPVAALAQGLAHRVLHLERGAGGVQGLGSPGLEGMRGFSQPEPLCVGRPSTSALKAPVCT